MAAEEFARLFYAMNRALEEATEHARLSKRAGIVLWMLASAEGGCLQNRELVRKFGAWQMSRTPDGASRDVSVATAELERSGWITMRREPYRVCISEAGRIAADALAAKLELAIDALQTCERQVLSPLINGKQIRKPVGREERLSELIEDTGST